MMPFTKMRSLISAVTLGLAATVIAIGLLEASPALASGRGPTGLVSQVPADYSYSFGIVFTDPAKVEITDLSGNVLGKGVHQGVVKCKRSKCSQTTQLTFGVPLADPITYEYKFTTRQALDPEAERAVVAGTGIIASGNQKERFLFTAIFQNNRDGTIAVRYEASNPAASFNLPSTAGTFTITSKR